MSVCRRWYSFYSVLRGPVVAPPRPATPIRNWTPNRTKRFALLKCFVGCLTRLHVRFTYYFHSPPGSRVVDSASLLDKLRSTTRFA